MRRLVFSLVLAGFSSLLAAQPLQPFSATYTADWKQLPFSGTAERSLKPFKADEGRWELSFKASMLVAAVSEQSELRLHNGSIRPLSYRYERTGLGKPKKSRQTYDWQTGTVSGKEKKDSYNLPLQDGILDKSSYQLALQRDLAAGKNLLSYKVLDGDDLDIFDFRILGDERIDTPAGPLNTVKVERVRDPGQSQRRTTLWFAKDWDYLLVQLNQVEKDGKEYTIMLEQGQVGGKQVKGR